MQRRNTLKDLYKEHRHTVDMAKNIALWAHVSDTGELTKVIERVRRFFSVELDFHFQHEEQTIFATLLEHFEEFTDIAITLRHEHEVIRKIVKELNVATARENLSHLAVLLQDHTRIEERHLFPLIESLFSQDQMELVLGYYDEPDRMGITA